MPTNIMLINPPVHLDRQIVQPLGIASIASELRKTGYSNISLIDGCYLTKKYGYESSFHKIKEEIENKKPFIVGCTFNNATLPELERICKYAFKSNSHVILGGHAATACHESMAKHFDAMAKDLNSSSVTAVVRGEGERTARELTDALFQGRSLYGIKGITFYDGNEVVVNPDRELMDINMLEPPGIDLLPPVSEYAKWFNIEESRGCVFQCSFCSISSMYPVVRLKNPERIRIEVDKARESGAEKIYLTGELLLLDEDRALAVSDIMKSYNLKWSISAHPSLIHKARRILPALRINGLDCIEIGIEGATQRSLDIFNKGTTPEKNRDVVKILEENEIPAWLHIIPFHPYMNMRDLYENIMYLARNLSNFLSRDNYLNYLSHEWIPAEGTPLFERAMKDKLIIRRGGGNYVKYEDKRVIEVKKSYDSYFIKKYGKEYYELHKEMLKILDSTDSEDIDKNNKYMMIETLPLSALYVSYCCAIAGIPAQKHIKSLVSRSFDIVHSGNINVSYSDICDSVLEAIEEEKAGC